MTVYSLDILLSQFATSLLFHVWFLLLLMSNITQYLFLSLLSHLAESLQGPKISFWYPYLIMAFFPSRFVHWFCTVDKRNCKIFSLPDMLGHSWSCSSLSNICLASPPARHVSMLSCLCMCSPTHHNALPVICGCQTPLRSHHTHNCSVKYT